MTSGQDKIPGTWPSAILGRTLNRVLDYVDGC